MRKCWQVCIIPALLLTTAVPAGLALAQEESKELSIELIDPKVLRVCADPRNMPFSDQQGEGFENKLAELFAQKLGKSLSYVWYPQATGFVRNTLGAHKCDVIALRKPHDDVALVGAERVAHESGRLRIPDIGQALAELLGEEFSELVLEAFALLVRERHVARIGADAEHLGIDQLDRKLLALLLGKCQARRNGRRQQQRRYDANLPAFAHGGP